MDESSREISLMRLFSWLLLLSFLPVLLPSAKAQFPAHVDTALTYFGPKEQVRENYGLDIKKFLGSVGLGQGYPYCAAFNSYCLDAAGAVEPTVRSASSRDFITEQSIDAKKVLRGQKNVPRGWIHVMPKGETPYGHTGIVIKQFNNAKVLAIDANTGTGLEGESEREGQGVWVRIRQIYSSCYFCIKYFTPVKYEN